MEVSPGSVPAAQSPIGVLFDFASPGSGRRQQLSNNLRADFAAFNYAALGYAALHEMSLRLYVPTLRESAPGTWPVSRVGTLLEVDGQPVQHFTDVQAAIRRHAIGEEVSLRVWTHPARPRHHREAPQRLSEGLMVTGRYAEPPA